MNLIFVGETVLYKGEPVVVIALDTPDAIVQDAESWTFRARLDQLTKLQSDGEMIVLNTNQMLVRQAVCNQNLN